MNVKKSTYAFGIITLFLLLSLSSSGSAVPSQHLYARYEIRAVEKLMDTIEDAAYQATTFDEFRDLIRNLFNRDEFKRFPILTQILEKLMDGLSGKTGFVLRGHSLTGLRDRSIFPRRSVNHFVMSYGAYRRYNPWKENQLKLMKEGITFWHYGGQSAVLKGRSLILERQPFGIKQRMLGPQFGFMTGFRGIYIDFESRLTGNAYAFFFGRAHRIRAFDLTPLQR